MSQSKKLFILENARGIFVEIPWPKFMSIFAFFFGIVWLSIPLSMLVVLINTGGPIPFILFVGLFALVGALPLAKIILRGLNTTYLNLDNRHLKVHTSPFSWKSKKVNIPISTIDQFYVSEKHMTSQKDTHYSYELMVRLNDGSNQTVIPTRILTKDELIALEDRLEKYLGIQDRPIKGEVDSVSIVSNEQPTKRHKRNTDDYHSAFISKKIGDEILFDGSYQRIIYSAQYDWEGGTTDVQYQISSASRGNTLIYMKQDKGLHDLFIERKLELHQSNTIAFNYNNPQSKFEINGIQFQLVEYLSGSSFVGNHQSPIPTKQWFYRSLDGDQSLRIVSANDNIAFYEGKLNVEELDLIDDDNEYLDLKQPIKEMANKPDQNEFI